MMDKDRQIALGWARKHYEQASDAEKGHWEFIFPELKDSEDEMIRKRMIEHFKSKTKETWCNMPVKSILAWLEKQKEQKPEVDLEKEFQEYWYLHQYEHRLRRQVMDGHGKSVLRNVARHFYELGLNAKKE